MSEVKGVRAKGQVSESNFQCIEFFVFQIQRGWALSTDQRTTKILPEECDFTVQFSYHLNIDAMGYSNTSSLHNGYTRLCWHMGFVVLCIIIQCLSHTLLLALIDCPRQWYHYLWRWFCWYRWSEASYRLAISFKYLDIAMFLELKLLVHLRVFLSLKGSKQSTFYLGLVFSVLDQFTLL